MTQNQVRSALYLLTLTAILANCSKEPIFSARSALNAGVNSSPSPKPETSAVQPGVQAQQTPSQLNSVNLLVCGDGTDCYEEPIPTASGITCPSNKILVCKIPPGNPSGQREHCYPQPAVSAHLATGSHLGMCKP